MPLEYALFFFVRFQLFIVTYTKFEDSALILVLVRQAEEYLRLMLS